MNFLTNSIPKEVPSSFTFQFLRREEYFPLRKQEWINTERIIKGLAGPSHKMCGEIPLWWILQNALPEADVLVLVYMTKQLGRHTKEVCTGFSCLQFRPLRSELYVDLICAKNAGRQLMNAIFQYGKNLGLEHITLSALPSSLLFYRKLGFKHIDPCSTDQCNELPEITEQASKVADYKFENHFEAEEHKPFHKLLRLLIKNNLTKNKKCKRVPECRMDGYLMSCCLHAAPPQEKGQEENINKKEEEEN